MKVLGWLLGILLEGSQHLCYPMSESSCLWLPQIRPKSYTLPIPTILSGLTSTQYSANARTMLHRVVVSANRLDEC